MCVRTVPASSFDGPINRYLPHISSIGLKVDANQCGGVLCAVFLWRISCFDWFEMWNKWNCARNGSNENAHAFDAQSPHRRKITWNCEWRKAATNNWNELCVPLPHCSCFFIGLRTQMNCSVYATLYIHPKCTATHNNYYYLQLFFVQIFAKRTIRVLLCLLQSDLYT